MRTKSRRRFIQDSAGTLGAAFLVREGQAAPPQAQPLSPGRPNVVLIMTDQQRIDTLGFRGLTPCRTPTLDRLAREGVSFDRCLTPSPICTPARSALFTGLYAHQTGTLLNGSTLESDPALLTGLRTRGYQINYAGKWHLGKSNIDRWVDRWAGEDTKEYSRWCKEQGLEDGWAFNDPEMRSHRRNDVSVPKPKVSSLKPEQTNEGWVVDHALRLLETRDRSRPFFLSCSLNGPHPPFKIPEPYYSMYDPASIAEPPNFGPTPGEPAALGRSFYRTVFRDHGESWEAWKKSVAVYWGFTTMVDAQIGRLIARLEQDGLLDNTLIVMATDHGEMLGQHGLWQKYHGYEEALRVPLILRAPWLISAGLRSPAPASLIDVAPTILSACEAPVPPEVQGLGLSPHFSASAGDGKRRVLFSEFQPKGAWHGVVDYRLATDNRHKYIWNRGDVDELYDLSTDPHELGNLAKSDAARSLVDGFQKELLEWMRRTRDPLLSVFEKQARSSS